MNLPSVWLPLSAVCSQENLEILEKKRIHLEKIAAASSQKILTCDTERHVRFFPEKMEQHEQHSKISSCMIVQNSLGWSFDCRFVCASLFSLYIYIYLFIIGYEIQHFGNIYTSFFGDYLQTAYIYIYIHILDLLLSLLGLMILVI